MQWAKLFYIMTTDFSGWIWLILGVLSSAELNATIVAKASKQKIALHNNNELTHFRMAP